MESTRIIIKNLPQFLTEEKLKEHIEKKYPTTDVRIQKTRDGRSRRFAFVGFKEAHEAKEAASYFNNNFIGSSRVTVDLTQMPRKANSSHNAPGQVEGAGSKRPRNTEDSTLNEYLDTFSGKKRNIWENDLKTTADGNGPQQSVPLSEPSQLKGDDSDDEYESVPNKSRPQEDEQEEMMSLDKFENPTDSTEPAQDLENEDSLARDENISDREWLQMRRQRMRIQNGEEAPVEAPVEPQLDEVKERRDVAVDAQEMSQNEESKVIIPRLFLRNLSFTANEESLRSYFSRWKPQEVHISLEKKTGKPKGFAYISFVDVSDAQQALDELDGIPFQGRLLHIIPAKEKKDFSWDEFNLKNLPLKKRKEIERRLNASRQQFSWNSLYLNQDAVLESAAKKLGISKSEMLDPTSSSSAVKAALAETSVISSVRQYFEGKGIDLLSFNKPQKDDAIILVKNFPFDTTTEDLTSLFGEFGELRKVLMPPDGGIAIVVFRNKSEAQTAFKKLAYRRFKSSILYLEKGPVGLFENDEDKGEVVAVEISSKTLGADVTKTDAKAAVIESSKPSAAVDTAEPSVAEEGEEEDGPSGPTTSVFIKNLNFKTTSQDIIDLFKPLDGFVVAQVKTKPDTKHPGQLLSMGFGFAEFKTKENANTAIEAMDGYVLSGHKIQLKLSTRGGQDESSSGSRSSKAVSSKVLIKNVPFEATKKDLQQLLSAFGQLRSVRLPKKFNKSGRGFAFAEFVSKKEAQHAMDSLVGTHLLGRRLVMEYANEDAQDAEEEITRMTEKVRSQVQKEQYNAARLTGKRSIELEDEDAL